MNQVKKTIIIIFFIEKKMKTIINKFRYIHKNL